MAARIAVERAIRTDGGGRVREVGSQRGVVGVWNVRLVVRLADAEGQPVQSRAAQPPRDGAEPEEPPVQLCESAQVAFQFVGWFIIPIGAPAGSAD